MELKLLEHLVRLMIILLGIGFAIRLGKHRPEWRSRKTLICWVWTMVAVDIMIMNGNFSESTSAQIFIGGALTLNVVNFIGDRIETIKFNNFSASLSTNEPKKKEKKAALLPDDEAAPPINKTEKEEVKF